MPSSDARSSLAGRRAVVTGGGRGIGFAIAAALAAAGSRVLVLDRDEAAVARTASQIDCATICGDIARDHPHALAEQVLGELGAVDIIVNNVGITTPYRFRELGETDFDLVFATNLRGPWFFTRRLVEDMLASGRPGAILFISSLHASCIRHLPHYSASKAAVAMLVKELAHELGPSNIRVNSLSPGWIDTGTGPGPGPDPERVATLIPLGRRGRPDDVAPVALALLDDAVSGYVTGADIVVDGGLALHSWLDDLDT